MDRKESFIEYPGIGPDDDQDIQITHADDRVGRGSFWPEAKSLLRDIFFAVVAVVLLVVFVVQPVKVEGTSMQPKLQSEERIFVNKFIYSFDPIQRDDIVVFWFPNDPSKSFIKRVIGLPGDTVRIDYRGQVFINGQKMSEPYLSPDKTMYPSPLPDTYVRPHYYFVMGDNRDVSNDSRYWGLVPEKYIYGKAMFRYWPLGRMGFLNH